jgi:predicted nucleic acid-binding protein
VIVDASVILSAFFPEEHQAQAQALIRHHLSGQVCLVAPTLLIYEVTNGVLQAIRRQRVTDQEGEALLASVKYLSISLEPVEGARVLHLARRFDRSAYDAAYLALAEARQEPLITGDLRLYRAVHTHLEWVQWIGDSAPVDNALSHKETTL